MYKKIALITLFLILVAGITKLTSTGVHRLTQFQTTN